jgi:hypothetical protein
MITKPDKSGGIEMTNHTIGTSPLIYARTAGILLLIILACAIFSMMYVPSNLIVPGDATGTASNIRASESLFRLGLVGESILFLSEIVLTVMLYLLLKPVSKTLSLVAAFARLAMTVMQGTNLVFKFAALLLLSGAGYLTVFEPDQLHALVLLLFDAHNYGALVWGTFFSLHCFVLGYLIFKSGYFPRVLGVLMIFAALGYLADSFGNFLSPSYEERFAWVVTVTGFVGELPFFLWLLIKGVNVQKWNSRVLESARLQSI